MAMLEKRDNVSDEDIKKLLDVFGELSTSNVWAKVKKDDFTVRRFAMGYVNDISCCELTKEARERLCKSPQDLPAIVVKFKPKETFFNMSRLESVASNTAMSELGITPRLIYVDDKCMINEYIESRNYKQEDDLEPKTVKQLARILAGIHSAQVPVSMNGFKLWQELFNDDAFDKPDMDPHFKAVIEKKYLEHIEKETPEIKEKYYSLLSEVDFRNDGAFTRNLSKAVKSPLVFAHNDFNRGNRIVQKVTNADGTTSKKIYIVDFDYSTFNYRGLDLGRYFSNYRHEDDMFGDEGFPTDDEMKLFLEEYRQECARIQGDFYLQQEENSLEQLIKETKVFTLSAYGDYFFTLMMYIMDPTGPKKGYFLQSAFNRFSAYKKQKKQFIDDGTIPAVLAANGDA